MYKRIGMFVLAIFAVAIVLAIGDNGSRNGQLGVSGAQAIVGRPLTPVSVAGVARRTARRCAVGVYYC
jgi:hypothetical protein